MATAGATTTTAVAVPGATIARQVGYLAAPVLVEQALLYLVGFSDTLLTGRYLRVEHLAAVTVGSYLLWFLGSLLMIVSAGATALVARLIGSGDRDGAARVADQSVLLAWVVGGLIGVVGHAAAPTVVRLMNLDGPAATEAAGYLRTILVVTPLMASLAVGVACLRGAGDTRTGMYIMILVNGLNAAFSWAFVTGVGPFPALGLRGVALGTAIGEAAGGVLVLIVLRRGRSGLRIRLAGLRPDRPLLRRLLRISLPAAGETGTNSLCQLWFLGLINQLGDAATAAHGVAIRCEAIAFLTVTAFAVAAGTLTGQYLGARRPDLAARAARTAWGLGAATLAVIGVLLYLLAPALFALFLGSEQRGVAALGVPVLRVVAFSLPALATINVLSGSLRGAGDTRWPWLFVLIGYLGVRLPLSYWLIFPPADGGLGWGLFGAWVAMLADLHVRALLVATRFLQGGWRRVRV